ncbi:unnamed protein product [Nezara viridula]|uniref:G-protein coupled receptors family 1 profile domain-containing protein n=1 Tax=Nezara viridula TaxID=85310 RepID=A0A9P0H1E4_NEZVI|nr:unnamed protein product [Nezara viridula]
MSSFESPMRAAFSDFCAIPLTQPLKMNCTVPEGFIPLPGFNCTWLWHDNNLSFYVPYEDETLYEVPGGIIVLLSVFYGTISVVAVVGNFLVMWIVATSRRMQNVTNCFIANLALADIVIGLFAIPFQSGGNPYKLACVFRLNADRGKEIRSRPRERPALVFLVEDFK